jgi:hypothetical protein
MFGQQDLQQIGDKGIELPVIQKQIDRFISGFPFISLVRPATTGDGILKFDTAQLMFYVTFFNDKLPNLQVVKFVPASGAASRMFKHLYEFREKYTADETGKKIFLKDQCINSVYNFITNLKKFAFYGDLSELVDASGHTVEQLLEKQELGVIIDMILSVGGLNYANLPKALIRFHQYPEESRTSAEEHLVEAAEYTCDHNRMARIHFTISPEHRVKFMQLFEKVQRTYESRFGVKYDVSFSVQNPSTDTIAVDENNEPVRNADGSLMFRPGGHGALLENLNETEADLIFIKNIDNIVPDNLKSTTILYKKLLGGYLLFVKEVITSYLVRLTEKRVSATELTEMIGFTREKLFLDVPHGFSFKSHDEQIDMLIKLLNRPLRVCGMVKNEGEPGGGPFWVNGNDRQDSLQIVENSQINFEDQHQKNIADQSTHFNPVDLVCCTKSFRGTKFNLKEFMDENTGFISFKSSGGKTLKAQELPGLWNGSMAKWITIFVEVPIVTFNPVKTINDLLRDEHLTS